MLKYSCQITTIQDNNNTTTSTTTNKQNIFICVHINLSFSSYQWKYFQNMKTSLTQHNVSLCHCLMSLSIIGPHMNHVNIEQRCSGKIFLRQQIRLHYNKDNPKEPHPLGVGFCWLVGVILISRLKLLSAMLMLILRTADRGGERRIFELSVSQVIEDAPGGNDGE